MVQIINIIQRTLSSLLRLIEFFMVCRALLSWFPVRYNSFMGQVNAFLVSITEPIILPARRLLSRWPAAASFPIDLSFLLTIVFLEILQVVIFMV